MERDSWAMEDSSSVHSHRSVVLGCSMISIASYCNRPNFVLVNLGACSRFAA